MAMGISVMGRASESLALCLMAESSDLIVQRQEIELLLSEMKQMKSFLTDAIKQQGESEELRNCVNSAREVAYEVDDFADDLYYEIMSKGDSNERWLSYFDLKFKKLKARFTFAREIASLTGRIRDINARLEGRVVRDAASQCAEESDFPVKTDLWMSEREKFSPLIDDFFVGMEDEKEKLVSLLTTVEEESNNFQVISVVGMGGLGKTTLAKKVYEDSRVRHHFESLAWVVVGRESKPRNIIESLLLQLCVVENREQLIPWSDLDLAQRLFESQLSKKYLVVLDDIWENDWECLRIAFPSEQTGSKVMLTTRCREATESIAVKKGIIHRMRCLNQEEGWELLQKKAFRGDFLDYKVDQDMMDIGKNIAKMCQGLPLAVVAMGGLLKGKCASHEWKMVHQNIKSYQKLDTRMLHQNVGLYLNGKDSEGTKNILSILELAYDALPHHLKQCFLYLGMFPEGTEIETDRLYLRWFAEGMIPYRDGESKVTMMDIAEGYLYELAIRNMVLVQEEDVPNARRFKSCHLHNVMRDLCLLKQKEEDFFDVIYFRRGNHMGLCSHSLFSTHEMCRLALYFEDGCVVPIDWNTDKYPWSVSLQSACQHHQQKLISIPGSSTPRDLTKLRVLSLGGFNYEVLRLPSVTGRPIPLQFLSLRDLPLVLSYLADFRRLRVLDISGFNFKLMRLPRGIEKLSRLRYLNLSNCNITRLPSSICNLLNLETLCLRDCPGMIIPNELQKLKRLKHLYLPRNFRVHGVEKLDVDALRELETLVNFDSRMCKAKDLFKLTKLRKLVVTIEDNFEDLETIINCINTNLSNLRLSSLLVRNLGRFSGEKSFVTCNLFECVNLHALHLEGHVGELPQNISPCFTRISFSGSQLQEDPIQKLEKLPNLWVLVLQNNAFLGKHMMCSSLGMPRLKRLMISNLQNLETLTFKSGAMPKLCTLAIENCQGLAELPEGLSFLPNLQQLRLAGMPSAFLNGLHERGFLQKQAFSNAERIASSIL